MARSPSTWLDVGADLARLLSEASPAYLSDDARAHGEALLATLRDDVWRVATDCALAAAPGRDRGQTATAEALGVGRATLHRWVRGGWLLATRGREIGE